MYGDNHVMERRMGDMPFRERMTLEERENCHGRGMPGRGRFQTLPERPETRDFAPHGPGGHGMPGGPGFPGMPGRPSFPGGMRPPEPSPDFLRERIEEADLSELLELAGRMARRRPEGGPAQGQNLILSILAGRESLSQRALQQMLGVQPGSLSEILTKLERKGYLTREKAEDRRGNLLRITDEGRRAIPDGESVPPDDRFTALTDEQQEQLAGLLRALLNDWVERFKPRGPERPDPHGGRFMPLKTENV